MRKCAVCGKKFTPKTANALVCGDKCYKKRKADLDKKRKCAKKADKPVAKKADKPVKAKAKKPLKANAVEKIVLPKKAETKTAKKPVKKLAKKPVVPALPDGCDTMVDIKAGNDFKVCTLALFIAFEAIGRLIKGGKIKPC